MLSIRISHMFSMSYYFFSIRRACSVLLSYFVPPGRTYRTQPAAASETPDQLAERLLTTYGNSILRLAYAYLHNMAEAVGFPVEELHQLPFSVEDTQYTVLGDQLAEIRYDGGTESAVFRKAAGADDPSGDYTAYSDIQEATLAGYDITLKGAEGQFTLGIWQKEGYSYSLLLSDPLPAEGWEAILQNIY